MTKIEVDNKLLEEAKKVFPETKGLTWTGLVDFLIRRAMEKK